jgi:hypothetical protein
MAEKAKRHRLALGRAEDRALAGKRPAGVDLAREAEEMSDEEAVFDDERVSARLAANQRAYTIRVADDSLSGLK